MAKRPVGPELLRARLKALQWTQDELAQRLGVSPAAVSRLLAGHTLPSRKTSVRLAQVAGVPVEAWDMPAD